jgi:predicted DNA-binding transcriptional regulator AlpA
MRLLRDEVAERDVDRPRRPSRVLGEFTAEILDYEFGEPEMNHDESGIHADRLLKVKEVAYILGISERSVWRKRSAGEIPDREKIGGSARWLQSKIYGWLANGCPGGDG